MKIQLIRHATILLIINGKRILIDPMLGKLGSMTAVPDVANTSDNPLVDLSVDLLSLVDVDAIIVTHTHRDHFDEAAMRLLSSNTPLFCQPEDVSKITQAGFTNVWPVEQNLTWSGIQIIRTGGQHGTGTIGEKMGPVSGFVLQADGEVSLYITGDTVWCPEVQEVLERCCPQIIVCFAGAAQFSQGGPITMTKEDVFEVCNNAPLA
ncbi:MAG TPA: MBL fold metallo-hydrolase, partial [Syntrophomonadaceae bacterium]|nr:MBL fold metallo-hydrolase [Syntrophomonadaceae bacterium]